MINGDIKAPGVDPAAGVLRHFNSSGNVIDSLGSVKDFRPDRLTHGFLVANEDRVGWYGPGLDGVNKYVEISLPTKILQTYAGLPKETSGKSVGIVERFALTPAGQAYVNCDHFGPEKRVTYQLDRQTEQWIPVELPAIGGEVRPHLKGSDGERLVFMGGNSATSFNTVSSTR